MGYLDLYVVHVFFRTGISISPFPMLPNLVNLSTALIPNRFVFKKLYLPMEGPHDCLLGQYSPFMV